MFEIIINMIEIDTITVTTKVLIIKKKIGYFRFRNFLQKHSLKLDRIVLLIIGFIYNEYTHKTRTPKNGQ